MQVIYPWIVEQFMHINIRIETKKLLAFQGPAFLLLKGFDALFAQLIASSQVRLPTVKGEEIHLLLVSYVHVHVPLIFLNKQQA